MLCMHPVTKGMHTLALQGPHGLITAALLLAAVPWPRLPPPPSPLPPLLVGRTGLALRCRRRCRLGAALLHAAPHKCNCLAHQPDKQPGGC